MSWCALILSEACSHVAVLLFSLEAACRLGYTNPSRTSMHCKWNQSFKTEVQFHYNRDRLLKYNIVLGNSSWVNWYWPQHSKNSKHKLPAKRIKVTGGPQDLPKIKAVQYIIASYMNWRPNFIAYAKKRTIAKWSCAKIQVASTNGQAKEHGSVQFVQKSTPYNHITDSN